MCLFCKWHGALTCFERLTEFFALHYSKVPSRSACWADCHMWFRQKVLYSQPSFDCCALHVWLLMTYGTNLNVLDCLQQGHSVGKTSFKQNPPVFDWGASQHRLMCIRVVKQLLCVSSIGSFKAVNLCLILF